ncbi:MAG: AMP-binding protein, partial [Gammaproteobacteria bacterium]
VVVQLPNVLAFVETYLALTFIGVIPVMALPAHRRAEVQHFVTASSAKGYVITDVLKGFDYRELARELRPACPGLEKVFVAGEPGEGNLALSEVCRSSLCDRALEEAVAPLRPRPAEVATMLLSGGTTSVSKLIPRTHDEYVLNAKACSEAAGFSADTVFLALLPLGHNYNLASPGLLGTFYRGGTVVIGTGTSPGDVFAAIEKERVTVVAAVVPLISAWLNSSESAGFDLSSLKVVQNGGARLPPELRARLRQQFGCIPQEIYGTAEGLINMTRLDD